MMPEENPPDSSQQPQVNFEEKHEQEEFVMTREDVPAVAALFNQVGSALTKVDSQQLDGQSHKRAMQLDKDRVIPTSLQPGARQQPPVLPSMPQTAQQHTPPVYAQPPPVASSVTLGVKDYEKIEKIDKKVSTLQRKLTAVDKAVNIIKESLELPKSLPKYKIVSDDVECVTTNTQTLLSVLSKQLANKSSDITITRC